MNSPRFVVCFVVGDPMESDNRRVPSSLYFELLVHKLHY